jgi:hypothetical protein
MDTISLITHPRMDSVVYLTLLLIDLLAIRIVCLRL